jgi:tetratricopeptide (TPR) repeat protein
MAKFVRYGELTFGSDFLFGTDDRGSTVRFSRAERILLKKFTQNGKSVLTRDDLLDAISGPGSDAADRNIDFVVNRLRRKLRDSARKPRYIATQYGEGYVWVADRVAQSTDTAGAFLVVGPVRGMRHLGPFVELARFFASELRLSLDRQTAKDSRVVLDEDCPLAEQFVGDKPRFAVELSFVNARIRLDCAITLKGFATGQIIWVIRRTISASDRPGSGANREAVEAMASEITTAIWDALTYRADALVTPADEPLAVRMNDAAKLLADTAAWMETQRRLRATLEMQPDDHRAKLMLATCIHSKYLTSGPLLLPQHDFRAQDEDEIERLVLSSLPHLQENPLFMMAASKLLYFIDRGHRPLAIKIAEEAFESTTAFATSFAILGQIRMLEGDIEEALSLFDQGLDLSQPGSEFQIYLMVLKCQALLASGQRTELDAAIDVLYATKPATRGLAIFYTPPDATEIAPEAQRLLEQLDETRAKALLVFLNYVCARLFRYAEHRKNILHGPFTLLVNSFGPGVVPDDLRVSVPALVASVSPAHADDSEFGAFRHTGLRPKG